jgi:hypothetical protein
MSFMEDNLISWWKNLRHNHKKNFIANFDIFTHNVALDPNIELYSQYKITFGTGMRDRLDSFIVEESNLLELTSLKKLIIKPNSFTDFSHLSYFADLEELYFTNSTVETLDSL